MANARTTDPVTSLLSAAATSDSRVRQMDLLLAAYAKVGKDGLTADEAAEAVDMLHTGYWKRVSDLLRDGMLMPATGTRMGRAGRPQRVLRITVQGRSRLAMVKATFKQTAKAA